LISGFASAFQTFARISQNGNWINIYACNVYAKTYGSVNVTLAQTVGALDDALPSGLLGALGNKQLDVPLALPNGRVGGADVHTGVCS
jgi:hypothetical protein